jgi:prepilin-type N-terminal cleavage/methylation domain-containing protein
MSENCNFFVCYVFTQPITTHLFPCIFRAPKPVFYMGLRTYADWRASCFYPRWRQRTKNSPNLQGTENKTLGDKNPTRSIPRKASGPRKNSGFTLIELLLVVAIGMILAAISIPVITNSLRVFTFKSSIAAFAATIQSTRYQAIYHGCPYQLAFKASTMTYTVASETPAAGNTSCLVAMSAPAAAIPLPGRGVKLNGDLTLFFHPSGQVQATVGSLSPTMTYLSQPTETITISAFGRIYVTP